MNGVRKFARLVALFAVAALLTLAGSGPAGAATSTTTTARPAAHVGAKQAARGAHRRSSRSHRRTQASRRSVSAAGRRAALRRRAAGRRRLHARRGGLGRDAARSGGHRLLGGDAPAARTTTTSSGGGGGGGGSVSGPAAAPADLSVACAGADAPFTPATAAQARAAATCLVNQERAKQGLGALTPNPVLEAAGEAHAQDMVDRDFFAHDNPSGASSLDRIRTAGYLTGVSSFVVGENLAFAAGANANPRALVDSWMASPAHRANILNASFREAGMGFVAAVPRTAGAGLAGGATLAQEFGLRD
jgi:uncharacterized protein YkwD